MKKALLLILLFFLALQLQAQCPFNRTNCRGECGNFSDEDGDGFCDFGLLVKTTETVQKENANPVPKKEKDSAAPAKAGKDRQLNTPTNTNANNAVQADVISGATMASDTNNIELLNAELDSLDKSEEQQATILKSSGRKSYRLISISLLTLGVYFLTSLFYKKKYIKKQTHRKIWNVVLLISFLFAGLIGLFLVFQINYHFLFSIYPTMCRLHVEFGIVMVIVSVIHCLWHIDYYRKIIKQVSKAKEE